MNNTKSLLAKLETIDGMLMQKTEHENRYRILLQAVHTAHVCLPPCTVCAMLRNDVPAAASRYGKHADRFWSTWPGLLRWMVLLLIGVQLLKAIFLLDVPSALIFAALLAAYTAGKYSGSGRFP